MPPTFRSPLLLLAALLTASALPADTVETIDYSRAINGEAVIPVYSVPYEVPNRSDVLEVLGRIKAAVERGTTLKVFDNATGGEITDPALITASAVVDRRFGALNFWDYTNGVILSAFIEVGDITGDPSYFDYNVRFYDFIFKWMPAFRELQEKTGRRNDFSRMVHMRALDHCGSITAALIKTQRRHPDDRCLAWIREVDNFISNKQFRLEDGTLARERPQTRSLWTDDFYMSIPFLAQMGVLTGETRYWDDAVRQVLQMSARLFIPEKGLYDHGWSENAGSCDLRFYWGRANGWATLAMAELLDVLPEDYPGRDKVLDLYRRHIRAVAELQSGDGLWHNLLDRNDSYLETSASGMFVYSIARGINKGWLPVLYGPVAVTGWNALATKVLPDGRVEGICEGTTYANDSNYYYHRGASANTTFFGSVILAGAEVIRLVENPALKIQPPRPNNANSAIHFTPLKTEPTSSGDTESP